MSFLAIDLDLTALPPAALSSSALWDAAAPYQARIVISAIVFILVILMLLIFGRRKPAYGYETDQPLLKANTLFLRVYPLCVLACWLGMLSGVTLIGIGLAAHFGYIDLGTDFSSFPPLELALYASAIPFGSGMGLWNFKDKRKAALARIAEHEASSKDAGLIRSY